MINLERKRELLGKYIEASTSFQNLVNKGLLSQQEATKLLVSCLNRSQFTEAERQWLLEQAGLILTEKQESESIDSLMNQLISLAGEIDGISESKVYLTICPSDLTVKVVNEEGDTLIYGDSFEHGTKEMQAFINNVVFPLSKPSEESPSRLVSLSDDEFAVIAAIRAEPNYEFYGEEKKLAYQMASIHLLEQVTEKTFSVTEHGLRMFNLAN
jgi:hypothetical protein